MIMNSNFAKRGDEEEKCVEHEYKDYSLEAAILESQQRRSNAAPGSHEPFPVLLHWMLEQTEKDDFSNVVGWLPHGRGFIVHQREKFVKKILPMYFNQSKYTSFQRQLSLYGFKRLTRNGPDRGGYYHSKFLRISRTFTRSIPRTKVKNDGPRKASSPDLEPDFYKMPKLLDAIHQVEATSVGNTSLNWGKQTVQDNLSEERRRVRGIPASSRLPTSVPIAGLSALSLPFNTIEHSAASCGLLPTPNTADLNRRHLLIEQLDLQYRQDRLLSDIIPATAHTPSLQGLSSQALQADIATSSNWLLHGSRLGNLFQNAASLVRSPISANLPTTASRNRITTPSSSSQLGYTTQQCIWLLQRELHRCNDGSTGAAINIGCEASQAGRNFP